MTDKLNSGTENMSRYYRPINNNLEAVRGKKHDEVLIREQNNQNNG